MDSGLSQDGGAGSTNLQAGRDVVVHGLTLEEVRQVALDVFRANFVELRGLAEEVAIGRADKITSEFLTRLFTERPDAVGNLQDPDVQRTLIRAQTEFACSGENNLETVLVDLLVDRTSATERDMRALALNEAISVAPRLRMEQRASVAAVFFVRYTRRTGTVSVEAFRSLTARDIVATGQHLSTRMADYQHIGSLGVGNLSIGQLNFGDVYRRSAAGYFHKGFPRERLDSNPALAQHSDVLFMPCMRDAGALQPKALTEEDIKSLVEGSGLAGVIDDLEIEIKNALDGFLLGSEEVVADLSMNIADVAAIAEKWDQGPAKNLSNCQYLWIEHFRRRSRLMPQRLVDLPFVRRVCR